jgi:hypothetical protein
MLQMSLTRWPVSLISRLVTGRESGSMVHACENRTGDALGDMERTHIQSAPYSYR